jgi:hypothetical protein
MNNAIDRARQLLIREGWIQHRVRSQYGRCLYAALVDCDTISQELEAVKECIRADVGEYWVPREAPCCLVSYNDTPGRTKGDVIALLRRASRVYKGVGEK